MSAQWILFGVIASVFYGYVFYDYDSDPDSCIATQEFQKRVVFQGDWTGIEIDEDKYIDIGTRFGHIFDICFYAAVMLALSGIAHTMFRNKLVRLPARGVSAISMWAMFLCTLVGIFVRFSHSGKVCSGDYLGESESTEGYLVTQGSMLAGILYIWITVFALGIIAILVSVFLMTS